MCRTNLKIIVHVLFIVSWLNLINDYCRAENNDSKKIFKVLGQKREKYARHMPNDKELHSKATESDWSSAKEVKIADKAFMAFRERVADNPDQIVRYEKGGKPLLVSDESSPPASIPRCDSCGGEREFEFQVMSQALSYLHTDAGVDSLDWGTLLVYTCKKSCRVEGYVAEYVWKQDFSGKDLVANK